MKILLNTSTSAMQFPVGGQEFTLLPRRNAHISQVQSIFAIVYDDSLDTTSQDFIARNVRRRYCINGTVDTLEKLRPSQILVIRNGYGAPLEQGIGPRSAELTLAGIKVRIPELFQGDESPSVHAPPAPTLDEITSKKPKQTRRAYVSRDGGYFETAWNQVKSGDTFMIREETGEYVEDKGEKEFVATGAAYVHGGIWTIPYVPLSQHKPVDNTDSREGKAVDTSKAGQSAATNTRDATGDDDDTDDDDDAIDAIDVDVRLLDYPRSSQPTVIAEATDADAHDFAEDASADDDDDSGDDAEGKNKTPTTPDAESGVGSAKPPPVGGGARNRTTKKSKRSKGQGRPAARR